MRRFLLASAAALGLAGCSLTIDPGSVKEPPASGCVANCGVAVACGVGDGCGGLCQPATSSCACTAFCGPTVSCGASDGCRGTCLPGSGCTGGGGAHTLQGQLTPAAGSTSTPGNHAVARGTVSSGAATTSAPSGHAISQGTLSP